MMQAKLAFALMVVMIFSGCSTGVPLQQTPRSKPVALLLPLNKFKVSKNVIELPYIYAQNMETAGICRVRLTRLQQWVNDAYKSKSIFNIGE